MMLRVTIEALVLLRDKYQRMLEMRRLHDSGVAHDPRAQMRALAAEFPGALRELDELPLATIEQRVNQLSDVIEQRTAPQSWMVWMVNYHGHLRAALRIKRMALPRSDLDAALRMLQRDYVAAHDEPPLVVFDRETLMAVLKPANGRLSQWVFARIAEHHGVSMAEVQSHLFPARACHV